MAIPATALWLYTLYQIIVGHLPIDDTRLSIILMSISGYGLLSLWWLAITAFKSVKRMVCREVPVLIKLGVGFGIITAAVMMVFSAAVIKNNIMAFWIFFCPLLLSMHLLFISKPNTDKYN